MPRSRSRSIRSRYWARIVRASTVCVSSSIRSASVDLPWSMWATMQKFRMCEISVGTARPWYGLTCGASLRETRSGETARSHARDDLAAASETRAGTGGVDDDGRRRGPVNPLVDSPAPMANIKSQKKRNIQNEKRHQRNVATKSALKTSTKRVQTAAASGDAEAVTTAQREAARALDKAASRGILHKKTAARRKSRLAKTANAASA